MAAETADVRSSGRVYSLECVRSISMNGALSKALRQGRLGSASGAPSVGEAYPGAEPSPVHVDHVHVLTQVHVDHVCIWSSSVYGALSKAH